MMKPSKKVASILALGMVSSLFVGTGVASASNGVAVSMSKTVSVQDDKGETQIGTLQIKEDSDYADAFEGGDIFTITLPSNVKWVKSAYTDYEVEATLTNLDTGDVTDMNGDLKFTGDYTLTVTIPDDANADNQETIKIPLYVNFDSPEEGTVYATIDGMDSAVPSGDYKIATVEQGGATVKATNTVTTGLDSTSGTFSFRITETSTGSLKEDEKITLTLPNDMSFQSLRVSGSGGYSMVSEDLMDYCVNDDEKKVKFTLDEIGLDAATLAGITSRGILDFEGKIIVEDDATEGDIMLEIEGSDNLDDTSLKIGTVADYGAALSVKDAKTVQAGTVAQELGTIVIYENTAGSATGNRSIKVTLPDGVKFADSGSANGSSYDFVKAVNVKNTTKALADSWKWDEDTLTITTAEDQGRSKIEIEMLKLNIRADFVGDIVATISGRAGIEGEVVIGTVEAPATASVEAVSDVKIGYQNQALSDIVIKENKAGNFKENGYVYVELPSGVDFADEDVKVAVTDGNLEIESIKVKAATDKANGYVSFKIKEESTSSKPGTITISGLYLNVDRTVAEGPIKAIVKGDAIVMSDEDVRTSDVVEDEYGAGSLTGIEDDFFFDEDELCRVVIANCVTPGSGEVTSNATAATSTFVIGSTASVIAGADTAMPVAPYISNSRTMTPVRYVAYACGISESNVIWNPDNRTVTMIGTNGSIVQLTIGSNTMLVNGVSVIMDVAPEITGGYTFLPARYVANAFGYDTGWEAATQTVTITPVAK